MGVQQGGGRVEGAAGVGWGGGSEILTGTREQGGGLQGLRLGRRK